MKKLLIISIVVLSGCAKVSDYQASCEQRYSKLSEMASCLDDSIKNDWRMKSASTPKLYALAAKSLGEKVDSGQISETDARLQLQSLYVGLQRQEGADNLATSQALQQSLINQKYPQQTYIDTYNALKPEPKSQTNTTCQRFGNTVNCQSY